jgi:hypothetical protein
VEVVEVELDLIDQEVVVELEDIVLHFQEEQN